MDGALLVLNAGSSSLKFEVFHCAGGQAVSALEGRVEELHTRARFEARGADGRPLGTHAWPEGDAPGHRGAVSFLLDWLEEGGHATPLLAAGHRVVHGGPRHAAPVRVDDALLDELDALVPLAPLHQPHNLAGIRAVAAHAPGLPQVACFDTAFHRDQDELAQCFAIPRELTEAGVRRYGFHGLSYECIAGLLPSVDERAARGRTIVAHLGNGASLCAMHGGRSVATTMGFTALDGLPMGTRCGQLDPGVLLWLMDERGLDARGIERLLYKESGLLGVSGVSSDMRDLLASDDPRCAQAVELFCYRAAREIGSLAAALGGLDALVFTAGIGEHAAPVRARIMARCAWLGLEMDAAANAAHGPRISLPGSRVGAWVLPTDEEGRIARHVLDLLGGCP